MDRSLHGAGATRRRARRSESGRAPRRSRGHLRPEGERIGLQPGHAVRSPTELVRLALAGVGRQRPRRPTSPVAREGRRRRSRSSSRRRRRPRARSVPTRRSARRDRPRADARRAAPRALVAPLPQQMQVELARRAHAAVSSMRISPTSGIEAQSDGSAPRSGARRPASSSKRASSRSNPGLARRQKPLVGGREVAVEERLAARIGPPLGRLHVPQQERGVGGVGERARHAGEVAERRALPPPLRQRAGRLAFEVDHHPVPSRVQSTWPRW